MKNKLNLTNGLIIMLLGIIMIVLGFIEPIMVVCGIIVFLGGVILDNREYNKWERENHDD